MANPPVLRLNPRGILAIDLALNTGWAYGHVQAEQPVFGSWVLPSRGAVGATEAALANELEDFLDLYAVRMVVLAAPLRGIYSTSDLLLIGLAAVVKASCYRCSAIYREESEATMRGVVLGRTRFPKDTVKAFVMAWARKAGLEVENDDEADACLVWKYFAHAMEAKERNARRLPPQVEMELAVA